MARQRYSEEFKQKVVAERLAGATVNALRQKYGIGKKTVWDWTRQVRGAAEARGRAEAGSERSPGAGAVPPEVEAAVVSTKRERMFLGSRSLRDHLRRFLGIDLSVTTVNKLLRKHGFKPAQETLDEAARANDPVKAERYREEQEQAARGWQRFERPLANDLWQIDIMTFAIRGLYRVYLITVLDDHSRYVVNWGLFREQTAENVREVLRGALARYGLPREILTDRGGQFTAWRGVTAFARLLAELGIHHTRARAHHPQTVGKLEAFHRNFQRERIDVELFRSFAEAVQRIGDCVEHYNHVRCHQGIDGYTPADRYFGIARTVAQELQRRKETRRQGQVVHVGRPPLLYLVGQLAGQDLRVQEDSGRVRVYLADRLVQRLQAELAQAAAREKALRGQIRVLQAALTMAQRFIRLLAGGQDFTAGFVRFSGAEKLQVCRLAWEAKQQGISLRTFARGLGKFHGTLPCWYQRYDPDRPDAENIAALTDRESTPARVWNTLDPWVVAVTRRVAQRYPDWGGRQIAWHLRQLTWTHLHVAPATVYKYLAEWRRPRQGGPDRRNRYCFVPGWPGALTTAPSRRVR